jgi:hypothetical protein
LSLFRKSSKASVTVVTVTTMRTNTMRTTPMPTEFTATPTPATPTLSTFRQVEASEVAKLIGLAPSEFPLLGEEPFWLPTDAIRRLTDHGPIAEFASDVVAEILRVSRARVPGLCDVGVIPPGGGARVRLWYRTANGRRRRIQAHAIAEYVRAVNRSPLPPSTTIPDAIEANRIADAVRKRHRL